MNDIAQALEEGKDHHRAGRLVEAEQMYRRVLQIHPRHAGAAHLLGLIALQLGKHEAAAECLEKAVEFDAHTARYRADLGEVYRAQNRIAEAIATYRKALELNPNQASAKTQLGTLLAAEGQNEEAATCYQEALALDENHAPAHAALGTALLNQGQADAAQARLEQAARLAPANAEVCFQLGRCLHEQDKLLDAIACYQKVAKLRGDAYEPHYQLGRAYQARGQMEHAATHFGHAARLAPGIAETHYNLAVAQRAQGLLAEALQAFRAAIGCDDEMVDAHLGLSNLYLLYDEADEAAASAERALELAPESSSAAAHLAAARQLQGDLTGAIAAHRRAVELAPDDAAAHNKLLYALAADSSLDAQALAAEHRAWAERHAEPLSATAKPRAPDRAPDKRLRVGYVSPYFREHASSCFSLPLLAAHNHEAFEIFCYTDSQFEDGLTGRFRETADHWVPIVGTDDEAVARRVEQDEIDLLIDLAGFGSRLLMFARRPAPVQIAYLGDPHTSGMSAMAFRLTDEQTDPKGATDGWYDERLVRLPGRSLCYAPPEGVPAVNELPALDGNAVTFAWLNDVMKLTPAATQACAGILSAAPASRLLVLGRHSAVFENRLRESLAGFGIDAARVEVVPRGSREENFRLSQRIDVALDAFPANEPSTVCDALWMGVPSVVLEGPGGGSRTSSTAMRSAGMDALIARTPQDFVRIAAGMASDLPRLSALRKGLREQMSGSALMDASGLAGVVEAAYRQIWQAWCRGS